VFVPLEHRPGEAQVDFGHALVKEAGQLRTRPFFAMSLPYSDAFFVQVFARECTESFWEGHVRAFEFFGAVPKRISYDNSKVAVSKITRYARTQADGRVSAATEPLPVRRTLLPAGAGQREGGG
jgi:transposase